MEEQQDEQPQQVIIVTEEPSVKDQITVAVVGTVVATAITGVIGLGTMAVQNWFNNRDAKRLAKEAAERVEEDKE